MVSLARTHRSIPHWTPTIGILPNGAVGVQSERHPGRYWTVRATRAGGTCTCPDWQFRKAPRGQLCKHQMAVQLWAAEHLERRQRARQAA